MRNGVSCIYSSVPGAVSEAYRRYMAHTTPFLSESGGSMMLMAAGGKNLIGPADEQWDVAMIIRQRSLADFMAFASNPDLMAGMGHRKAALLDSRLLPMIESKDGSVPWIEGLDENSG